MISVGRRCNDRVYQIERYSIDNRRIIDKARRLRVVRLPMLLVATLLDLLTLRLVPALRVRSKILIGLLKYYVGVMKTGSWLSPRARENQFA